MTASSASGLKLLILSADYPPHAWSGIAAAASNHALAFLDEGADVRVLTRVSPLQRPPSSHLRFEVRGLDEPVFPFRGASFDWIHLHSLALSELAFQLRLRSGARVAYTAHSVISCELEDGRARKFWSEIQLQVMRECDAVILLSESERNALASIAPEIARRAHVIANAVPMPSPGARTYDRNGPVVFAGRFTAKKGLATLRQFLPSLLDSWRGRVVLAGGHGDRTGNQAIQELRVILGDSLSSPGWLNRAELDRLFAQASLVLIPSCYEPFGMVAVEAMRAGVPVLAARVGGLAEILTPESGGLLVGSRDPAEWRDRALDILRDDCLAGALAQRGPEYVKACFHLSNLAGRLMREVYAN